MNDTVMEDVMIDGKKASPKWTKSEKVTLQHFCNVHGITVSDTGKVEAPRNAYAAVVTAMTAQSLKHHPGGELHQLDPWPVRTYNRENTKRIAEKYFKEPLSSQSAVDFALNAGLMKELPAKKLEWAEQARKEREIGNRAIDATNASLREQFGPSKRLTFPKKPVPEIIDLTDD